jgi:hypothetical protein
MSSLMAGSFLDPFAPVLDPRWRRQSSQSQGSAIWTERLEPGLRRSAIVRVHSRRGDGPRGWPRRGFSSTVAEGAWY